MAKQLSRTAPGTSHPWLVPGIVALGVLGVLTVLTLTTVEGMAFVGPFHAYLSAVSGPASFALPVAASLIGGWQLRQLLADRHLDNTRTRAPLARTLRRACWPTALAGGLLGASVPLTTGLLTLTLLPARGYTFHPDSYYVQAHEIGTWNQQAVAAGELAAAHPWLFVVVHSLWVGLWCALLATFTQALLLIVRRPFTAFLVPMACVTVTSVALALARLETFTPTASQFPTFLSRFPWWHVLPAALGMILATGAAWWWVARRLPDLPEV
ncbi:hypothetical protein SAMN05445756_0314 [Kytococcus aerolatus]|uniref:Uncharacterized protein n=1 Tax=Kytococcus aerolatus TaxID=592308 RepID=A0A212T3J4_9MICO|nr:hypothetical protein [Kytococcus aerolatus]SNC60608.1 hypothetical protein SAMN05445756_0314 [Kytococcus aerolatus]